jgi:hypothetical protein
MPVVGTHRMCIRQRHLLLRRRRRLRRRLLMLRGRERGWGCEVKLRIQAEEQRMRRGGAGRPGQAKPMKRTGLDHAASASSRSSYVATAGFVDRYTLSPGPTPGPAAPARSTAYAPGARGSAHSHAGGTRGSLARARRLQRLGTDTMPRDRRGVPGGAAPCCPGPAKAKSESRRGSSTACPCRTTTATRHSGRRMLKPCAGATRSGRNACRARGARRATCCCTSCMPACG